MGHSCRESVIGLLRANAVNPTVVEQVRGLELQRSMVANGFGVSVVHPPTPAGSIYDGKQIISLPLTDDMVPQRVLIACHGSG